MSDLTKKRAPDLIQWRELCLPQVKDTLYSGLLALNKDTSNRGFGEGGMVQCISHKLSIKEDQYNTIEKECLAIKQGVLTLSPHLLGLAFTLFLHPLQCICHQCSKVWITLWYLDLQLFKFELVQGRWQISSFVGAVGGFAGCECKERETVSCRG